MSWSIWGALGLYFLGSLGGLFTYKRMGEATTVDDIRAALDLQLLGNYSFDIMFGALTYHTSYRALLLIFPTRQHRIWLPALAVAIVQCAIYTAGSYLFSKGMKDNFGTNPNPHMQRISIALVVYTVVTDTVFFVASQVTIISIMGQFSVTKPSAAHYADIALRCVLYSGAVALNFITAGAFFYSTTKGTILLIVPPCMMFMVLLTDADRVRKLVFAMQQHASPSKMSTLTSAGSPGAASATSESARLR
ncbi:hypothetical protein DFJ73DRAFT_960243 [Zopfochytrium polystomum]|nr:hypothetical protein DFJ73DRAFT_960243 [Zopfochytrium polystomum]